MSFNFKLMSPQEVAFVRLYTVTLKQEYDLFLSTLRLMGTESVALKNPVQAAKIARELQGFQADFDQQLSVLATRHDLRNKKPLVESPTIDELVKIIQISFFKLVTPKKPDTAQDDKGWFSGHPLDWDKVWKKAPPVNPPSELENAMTALFGALFKLLHKPEDDYKFPNVPGFPYKKLPPWNVDDELEDEYYEDDENDDFETPY